MFRHFTPVFCACLVPMTLAHSRAHANPSDTEIPSSGSSSAGDERDPVPSPPVPAHLAPPPTTRAYVELYVSPTGGWLELRPRLGDEPWVRICDAPCNAYVDVDGREARVNGSGATASNPFRLEPGTGVARLEASLGSARDRRVGTVLFALGLPFTLLGLASYGMGERLDSPVLRSAGALGAGMGAGGLALSFPFLARGRTRVRDERGHRIAQAGSRALF